MSKMASASSNTTPLSDDQADAHSSSQRSEAFVDLDLCGIALATMAFDGRPVVGKCVGFVATNDALRVTLRKSANEKLIGAVQLGSPVAVTFSRPTTHGSIQFKARSARIDEPDRDDFLAAQRQRERFSAELVASAYPPEFSDLYTAYAPHDLLVLEFEPEEVFDQSPGPAAGARLK